MMGAGPMRVDGNLAVSRGLGDFEYKQGRALPQNQQKVSCQPDVKIVARNVHKDELLVLACDGIWDVMSNEQCCQELRKILMEGETRMGLVAEELLDECLCRGSKDNMSAIVVAFPAAKLGSGAGVSARRAARPSPEEPDEAGAGASAYGRGAGQGRAAGQTTGGRAAGFRR